MRIRLIAISPVSQGLRLPTCLPGSICVSFGESTGLQDAQETGPGNDVLVCPEGPSNWPSITEWA